jgi:hypothetical protein
MLEEVNFKPYDPNGNELKKFKVNKLGICTMKYLG